MFAKLHFNSGHWAKHIIMFKVPNKEANIFLTLALVLGLSKVICAYENFSWTLYLEASHVMGWEGHHWGHVVVSGPRLEEDLLASEAARASLHLCVARAVLGHVLVPGGAGGLRHAAPALRGRALEARAAPGGRAGAGGQIIVDRGAGLPQRDDLAAGVVRVPVEHVRVRGVEHRGLPSLARGHHPPPTPGDTGDWDLVVLGRGRGASRHRNDGGPGRDGGRHQHLARPTHRVKVGEWP